MTNRHVVRVRPGASFSKAARVAARLDRSGLRVWVDRATGAILVAMGFYLIWRA